MYINARVSDQLCLLEDRLQYQRRDVSVWKKDKHLGEKLWKDKTCRSLHGWLRRKKHVSGFAVADVALCEEGTDYYYGSMYFPHMAGEVQYFARYGTLEVLYPGRERSLHAIGTNKVVTILL